MIQTFRVHWQNGFEYVGKRPFHYVGNLSTYIWPRVALWSRLRIDIRTLWHETELLSSITDMQCYFTKYSCNYMFASKPYTCTKCDPWHAQYISCNMWLFYFVVVISSEFVGFGGLPMEPCMFPHHITDGPVKSYIRGAEILLLPYASPPGNNSMPRLGMITSHNSGAAVHSRYGWIFKISSCIGNAHNCF